MDEYIGKKIVILGLAKSGTAIAKIFHRFGAYVIVNDLKAEEKCTEKKELEKLGIIVICGHHPEDLVDENTALLIKNPGITYEIQPVIKAEKLQIPIVTEVEIAYRLSKAPIIGITGSNGKTTTTTLIGTILQHAGKKAIVAGNIGTVLSEKALTASQEDILVAELSSFQLKGTHRFKPHIAVLLNIYPAHLDYHQTFDDYIQSKSKIFQNQTDEDYAVINANCQECLKLVSQIKSGIYLFSTQGPVNRGAYIQDDTIYWKDGSEEIQLLSLEEVFLKGAHLENVLAAVTVSFLSEVKLDSILDVLRNFKGVEHRVEYVLETKAGVIYYNDSKATNPQATIAAITSFKQPIILIAGGLDRGIDFHELIEPFKAHVKTIITYGQTAEKLNRAAKMAGIENRYAVDNVTSAVKTANGIAHSGDIVLLSPACASWDMFSSFEERGRMFKEAVHKLN